MTTRPTVNRTFRAAALSAAVGTALALAAPAAKAVDVDAGDYTALPAGTNLFIAYAQFASRDGVYAGGNEAVPGAELDSQVGILRGVHFMQMGRFIVDPQFLLPFGKLDAGGTTSALGDTSGIGDLILAATVWLVNDPDNKRYFGVTPFLFLPTGSYDKNRALNLGENRWKFALQGGYIQGLGEKFSLDVIGDFTIYGKNDDFGATGVDMKQDASFQFQTFLRYHVTPTFDLRAGVSRTWGGETEVDGIDSGDRTQISKWQVGASYFVTPSVQLMANYGRDASVRDGFKEDSRINLRLLKVF